MNFAFSEEQEELRKIVKQFLDTKSPEAEVRRLMETEEGYDEAVWDQMAGQMGLQGLIIPDMMPRRVPGPMPSARRPAAMAVAASCMPP